MGAEGGGVVFRQSVAFSPEGFRLIHRGAACRAVDGLWVKDDIISMSRSSHFRVLDFLCVEGRTCSGQFRGGCLQKGRSFGNTTCVCYGCRPSGFRLTGY